MPFGSRAMRSSAARSVQPRAPPTARREVAQRVVQVHAHERRLRAVESRRAPARGAAPPCTRSSIAAQAELAEFRLHRCVGDALDRALVAQPIADEVRDRADRAARAPREFARAPAGAPWCRRRSGSRRCTAAGSKPASTREIAAGFGVAGARRARRPDAPSTERCGPAAAILGAGAGRDRGPHRLRAIAAPRCRSSRRARPRSRP